MSSPLAAALDPRVDEDTVAAQMLDEDFVATRQQVPAGYDEDIEQLTPDDGFDAPSAADSDTETQRPSD